MFETRVEAWLQQRGHTYMAFLAAAQHSNSLAADVAAELLAVSDFDEFVKMMAARRRVLRDIQEEDELCADMAGCNMQQDAVGQIVTVQVPEGVWEGQYMQVEGPQGPVAVQVPGGFPPGSFLQVQLPASA